MQLDQLISSIQATHDFMQGFAVQQVNSTLTVRNTIIGFYIVEYEQNGTDRAQYGNGILKTLAQRLKGIKGMSERNLYWCKELYLTYPSILQTLSAKFQVIDSQYDTAFKALILRLGSSQAHTSPEQSFPPEILLSRLSFSHFVELLRADTPLKRAFYEVQAIKNNWGVRELERAMSTLLFERTGLSTDKESMLEKAKGSMPLSPADVIKNPVLLEFLGLQEKPEYSETDLEQAIITHLQQFLIEMGRGFCFEARQKRISFGNTHYRIDLVFYHRILKCHVLLDLKIGKFDHADAGQMNVYLNYYRKNEMTEHDNSPVGIILCADKDDSLVEYATIDMPHEVFVSKYLVELPSVEELKRLIDQDRQQILNNG
jgi:predicted nuclease of restriction endonuclease-like (RecB) superfamily